MNNNEFSNLEGENENKYMEDMKLNDAIIYGKSNTYKKTSEKYSDLKSSGTSLIIVGIIGIAFIILKITKIINFSLNGVSDLLFTIVFSAIFVAVLILGIVSLLRSKKIAGSISVETETTDSIISWFLENFTAELIDTTICDDSDTDIPAYFNRTEYIKNVILNKHPDLEEDYVDSLIEEIYSGLFTD